MGHSSTVKHALRRSSFKNPFRNIRRLTIPAISDELTNRPDSFNLMKISLIKILVQTALKRPKTNMRDPKTSGFS